MARARKDAAPGTLAVQPHIPGLSRDDKKPTAPRRTEKVLQAHTRLTLASLGYQSFETGVSRKEVECKCPNCETKWKFTPTGWQGNTVGYPDIGVFRWNNFPAVFMELEMKGHQTPITREQQQLADMGRSIICYSEAEALQAVFDIECALHDYRFPDERRQRLTSFLRDNERHLGRR